MPTLSGSGIGNFLPKPRKRRKEVTPKKSKRKGRRGISR